MNQKIQKSMPIILSIFGSIGVVGTSILVSKETMKNYDKLKKVKDSNNKKDIAKVYLKTYTPAIIVGAATICSITAGTIMSKKIEASLSATCLMLDQTLRRYKGKAKMLLGEKAEQIEKAIASDICKEKHEKINNNYNDNTRLYYEDHIGFFRANPEDFQKAINKMNERIIAESSCSSLQMLLDDCNAELINEDSIDQVSFDYGWSYDYINEVYGREDYNIFVHISTEIMVDESINEDYYYIHFDKEPAFGISGDLCLLGGYNIKNI